MACPAGGVTVSGYGEMGNNRDKEEEEVWGHTVGGGLGTEGGAGYC